MKKKLAAILLCVGMVANMALPLVANDTEDFVIMQSETGEDEEIGFLVPVEQKTEVPEGYIGIYTAEDLDNVRNDLDANYILMNDIDLSEYENWIPIGDHYSSFSGIFDGNGFEINNLYFSISSSVEDTYSETYLGLFGAIKNATVENLELINVKCSTDMKNECRVVAGTLCGVSTSSTINNCSTSTNSGFSLDHSSSNILIGGIVGELDGGKIQNCSVNSKTILNGKLGILCIGGIAGCISEKGNITNNVVNNHTTSEVYDGSLRMGGVIGEINNGSYIFSDISAKLELTGGEYIGGIVGRIDGSSNDENKFNNCLVDGSITGQNCGGIIGIVGYEEIVHVFNSSSSCDISARQYVGGIIGEIDSRGETVIENCHTSGTFYGQKAGGILGYQFRGPQKAIISNCYSISDIYSCDDLHGVSGGIVGDATCLVTNCYSSGNIIASSCVGAIIGEESSSKISNNCYRLSDADLYKADSIDGEITGDATESSCVCLSDSEMQSASSFVGFDFDTVWEIGVTEGYPYPTLRDNPHNGENIPVEPDVPDYSAPVLTVTPGTSTIQTEFRLDKSSCTDAVNFFVEVYDVDLGRASLVEINATRADIITLPQTPGTYSACLYAIYDDGTRVASNEVVYTVEDSTPETTISTTFDTSAITLAEGETFDFAGIVSTTAENGLEAVQIDIHNYEDGGIGITHIRKTNTDEEDPLTGDTFDLSGIPSFKAGDTLTGTTQSITLSAGTSWKVYVYAKDTDGNTLGNSVVKRIDIVEAENENPLIGNKYVQTTNIDSFYGSPYIEFIDETSGEFKWVNPETGESGTDDFTYTVSGDTVTLTAGSWLLGNVADEIVLDIVDEDCLEVAEIIDYSTTEELSIGCTGVGDTFEVEMEIEQVKPEVDGLQDNYTVTQGESLTVNFTVTAGDGSNLKAVTVKNNVTGENCYRQPDISASTHTVSCAIPVNGLAVGTHKFVVYASADNYTVTDNRVATFTVTVNEKQQVNSGINITANSSFIDRVAYLIACNEKNVDLKEYDYGYVDRDDVGALSIGIFQWRAELAHDLLNAIVNNNGLISDNEVKNIIGNELYSEIITTSRNQWNKRTLTSEEAKKISALLSTSAGMNEQNYKKNLSASEYIAYGKKLGVTDERTLIVFADTYNLGGKGGAKRLLDKAIEKVNGDVSRITAELLLSEYKTDSIYGKDMYKQRWKRIEKYLDKWYGNVTQDINNKPFYETELDKLLTNNAISQQEYDNRKSVLQEAEKYCTFEWTAPVEFHTWKGYNTKTQKYAYNSNRNMVVGQTSATSYYSFWKGVTYRGLPYCAHNPNNSLSIDKWKDILNNATETKHLEDTANYLGISRPECTIYGIDCSGLVYRAYETLNNYPYGHLGTSYLLTNSNSPFTKTNTPLPGDILLKSGHVMIYAGTTSSGDIMVYESVADGPNGISGCVYRKGLDIDKYSYYKFKNISE